MTATIIAISLTAIAFGSLVIFVAGAFNAASNADDFEAMLERELDARIAEMMKGNDGGG